MAGSTVALSRGSRSLSLAREIDVEDLSLRGDGVDRGVGDGGGSEREGGGRGHDADERGSSERASPAHGNAATDGDGALADSDATLTFLNTTASWL